MNRDWTADIIKVCAVITATPRWVGALLAAEGFIVPENWQWWWIIASAIFSAGMAVTEGLAFAYVFNAWRVQKDKDADKLLWLALVSGGTFVIVLSPFIAAQVRHVTLDTMLGSDWVLWLWSGSVAASTIVIVASVGYAQKHKGGTLAKQVTARVVQVENVSEQPQAQDAQGDSVPKRNPKFDSILGAIVEHSRNEPFGVSQGMEWAGLSRKQFYNLVEYGEQLGDIRRIDRGQYIYANGKAHGAE